MSGSEALSPAFPRTFHFLSLTHSSKTCSTDSPGYPHCNCVYCQERNAAENREQSAPSTYEEFIHLQIILKQRERLEVYSSSSSPPSSTSTELSEDDVEENEHNYGVTGKFTPNFFPPENSIEKNIQTDTTRGIWEYNKKQAYVLQRGDVNRKRKFSDLEDVDESMEKSGMGGDGNTYSPDHAEERKDGAHDDGISPGDGAHDDGISLGDGVMSIVVLESWEEDYRLVEESLPLRQYHNG